jgi:hypothetical protein
VALVGGTCWECGSFPCQTPVDHLGVEWECRSLRRSTPNYSHDQTEGYLDHVSYQPVLVSDIAQLLGCTAFLLHISPVDQDVDVAVEGGLRPFVERSARLGSRCMTLDPSRSAIASWCIVVDPRMA